MIAKFKNSELTYSVKVTKLDKHTFIGTVIESSNTTLYPIGYYGTCFENNYFTFIEETSEITTPKHYDNSKGSLYKFSEEKQLNSYEFDIIKRVIRCRKKGNFKEDLEKTKFLIDLYLKEFNENSL
jgi:hypothetical protein